MYCNIASCNAIWLQEKLAYHISSINTTFSISTPVWYYMNTNNIDIVVILISSAPSNSTACNFMTPGIAAYYCIV